MIGILTNFFRLSLGFITFKNYENPDKYFFVFSQLIHCTTIKSDVSSSTTTNVHILVFHVHLDVYVL